MIGPKIRQVRQNHDLTLAVLAERTGLTASYLSQIERDLIDPSIASLRKIALALDVPIYTFLADEKPEHVLIRADQRKKLELPHSSIVYEFITPMAADTSTAPKMEMVYFQLEPQGWNSDEPIVHPADECIFIIAGTLEVTLGPEQYVLHSGDSLYIRENIPHRFYNPGPDRVIGISNICPPIY